MKLNEREIGGGQLRRIELQRERPDERKTDTDKIQSEPGPFPEAVDLVRFELAMRGVRFPFNHACLDKTLDEQSRSTIHPRTERHKRREDDVRVDKVKSHQEEVAHLSIGQHKQLTYHPF